MRFILLKILSSFAGSILWTVAFVAAYFISLVILPDVKFNPANSVTITFMIFVWTALNNIVSNLLISLSDTQKYDRMRSSILQTFNLNITLFLVSLPFYFIFSSVQIIAICYIVISTFASFVLLENFAKDGNFILTWLYWAVVALFLISISFFQVFIGLVDFTYVFFFIMPIINLMFTICMMASEYIAGEFYSIFGDNYFDVKK